MVRESVESVISTCEEKVYGGMDLVKLIWLLSFGHALQELMLHVSKDRNS